MIGTRDRTGCGVLEGIGVETSVCSGVGVPVRVSFLVGVADAVSRGTVIVLSIVKAVSSAVAVASLGK